MKRAVFCTLVFVCVALASRIDAVPPSPLPKPSGVATLAPSARARAMLLLQQAQLGNFDRSQFTEVMNQVVTPEVAAQIGALLRPLGTPQSMNFLYTEKHGKSTLYAYRLSWAGAKLDELMVLDTDQRVSGLLFRSPVDPPTDTPLPSSPTPTPGPTAPLPTPVATLIPASPAPTAVATPTPH
jgi:hypothetical protein